jgi:hypothetical protein
MLPIVTDGEVGMHGAGVSAEVDLFPLMNLYARMSQRAGRVVGKLDRSQDLCVVRGSGRIMRRAVAGLSPLIGAAGDGDSEGGEEGGGGAGDFVGELRGAMARVWAEVDGVDDRSGLAAPSSDILVGEEERGGAVGECAAAMAAAGERAPLLAARAPDDGLRLRLAAASPSGFARFDANMEPSSPSRGNFPFPATSAVYAGGEVRGSRRF